MISNEQIRNEQLKVIETGLIDGLALAQIMHKSTRGRSLWEHDSWQSVSTGNLVIELTTGLRISYQGFEQYDTVVELETLAINSVNEDRRYVIVNPQASAFRAPHGEEGGRLQIGLGNAVILWGHEAEAPRQINSPNYRTLLRKNLKPYKFEPSMRYETTNAEFRKLLNKCKTGTFCVITRNDRIGIFANREDAPTVHSLASDGQEFANAIAGVDYQIIYNSLYRRKASDSGLMNRLSSIGDFDITEFGIVDNRVYVKLSSEGIAATLIYHSVTGIPEVEIPLNTKRRRRNKQIQENTPDPVHVWENVLDELSESDEVEWTDEEEVRLLIWQEAHVMWCNNRNQSRSNSRAVWFSHYSMALIRNGEAPDELDSEILSKV